MFSNKVLIILAFALFFLQACTHGKNHESKAYREDGDIENISHNYFADKPNNYSENTTNTNTEMTELEETMEAYQQFLDGELSIAGLDIDANGTDEYIFDGVAVTKEIWEGLTERYLYTNDEGIERIRNEIEWTVLFEDVK